MCHDIGSEPPQVVYAHLASKTFNKGMQLYRYRPKSHLVVHIALDLDLGPVALNPMCAFAFKACFVCPLSCLSLARVAWDICLFGKSCRSQAILLGAMRII